MDEWPELEGEVPVGGWLQTDRVLERGVFRRMTKEAAKLRWWRDTLGPVAKLHGEVRGAIAKIGPGAATKG